MCFRIDQHARAPTKRIMWKMVRVYRGHVHSDIYRHFRWWPGVREANILETVTEGGSHAKHGIYVFDQKPQQWKTYWYNNCNAFVRLKVRVDPKDWICSNWDGTIHTYRKVTVLENQPDFDWY